jgi:hypothetical protein
MASSSPDLAFRTKIRGGDPAICSENATSPPFLLPARQSAGPHPVSATCGKPQHDSTQPQDNNRNNFCLICERDQAKGEPGPRAAMSLKTWSRSPRSCCLSDRTVSFARALPPSCAASGVKTRQSAKVEAGSHSWTQKLECPNFANWRADGGDSPFQSRSQPTRFGERSPH